MNDEIKTPDILFKERNDGNYDLQVSSTIQWITKEEFDKIKERNRRKQ